MREIDVPRYPHAELVGIHDSQMFSDQYAVKVYRWLLAEARYYAEDATRLLVIEARSARADLVLEALGHVTFPWGEIDV